MSDESQEEDVEATGYEPPKVVRLGSLTELTHGGTTGPNDGTGGAGDEDSL